MDKIALFISIEQQIEALYAQQKALIAETVKEQGDKPLIVQNPDGTWTRVTITDNMAKIEEGFWKFTRVERYSVKIDTLKTMPKELK